MIPEFLGIPEQEETYMCLSSDFWVTETISVAQDTGVSSGINYDGGSAAGKWFAHSFQALPQLLWDNQGLSKLHSWNF